MNFPYSLTMARSTAKQAMQENSERIRKQRQDQVCPEVQGAPSRADFNQIVYNPSTGRMEIANRWTEE